MRIILAFLFFTQLIIAQNINGIILDSKYNEPIENVTVYFKKGKIGTVTDAKGEFNIRITSKITRIDSLQLSILGYHSKTISLKELKKNQTIFFLTKKLETLDEVIVNSEKVMKTKIKFKRLASLKSRVFGFDSQVIGNKIYVVSGNSSYLENSGKRAIEEVSDIANPTIIDFIQALRGSFNYENYSNKLQIYDIENDEWSTAETKFRKRASHNLNCYGNTLYSLGGKRLSLNKKYEYLDDKIEVFDMASREITIDDTNPHQAINFASFTYNDNIIVMGGSTELKKNGDKVYTDASHIFNLTSGLWYELANMTSPKETQGVIINHTIYLVGGHSGNELNTIESYNIKTGHWTKEGELFRGMEHPALATHEDIIYMFDKERLLIYNTITKHIDEYQINLKLENSKLHYYQNKLYIIGGFTENTHTKAASANVYQIDLNEFDNVKPINFKTLIN